MRDDQFDAAIASTDELVAVVRHLERRQFRTWFVVAGVVAVMGTQLLFGAVRIASNANRVEKVEQKTEDTAQFLRGPPGPRGPRGFPAVPPVLICKPPNQVAAALLTVETTFVCVTGVPQSAP